MESASDIVDKIRELECGWLYELPYNEAVALIEADRAAIRKECADRAEAWYVQGVPEPSRAEYANEVVSLRAAIMGDEHE